MEGLRQREKWYYDGQLLERVNAFHYMYVGLLFSTKLSFGRITEDLATKSKYGNLSKTAFVLIIYMKVCPMLLHGSELWGLNSLNVLQNIIFMLAKDLLKFLSKLVILAL